MKKDKLLQIIVNQKASPLLLELKEALGITPNVDFGSDQIDASSLVGKLHPTKKVELEGSEAIFEALSRPLLIQGSKKINEIFERYDLHMSLAIKALALIKKDSPTSWQELSNQDFSLIPPVILDFEVKELSSALMAKLTQLMQSTREFKILVRQKSIHQSDKEVGRGIALHSQTDLGFFGLFFRKYYLLQAPNYLPELKDQLELAIQSPRPALISIYDAPDLSTSELALQTRAFPYLCYDPERGASWGEGLDL